MNKKRVRVRVRATPVNEMPELSERAQSLLKSLVEKYIDEVYRHMWSEPKKMDEVEIIRSALDSSDLPGEEIIAGTQDPAVKQALIGNTERSVQMGSFGSPTFYVNNEIFFGKDKLVDVEDEINARKED